MNGIAVNCKGTFNSLPAPYPSGSKSKPAILSKTLALKMEFSRDFGFQQGTEPSFTQIKGVRKTYIT